MKRSRAELRWSNRLRQELRFTMKHLGLTWAEAEQKSCLSKRTIKRFIHGQTKFPSARTLFEVATLLGYQVELIREIEVSERMAG